MSPVLLLAWSLGCAPKVVREPPEVAAEPPPAQEAPEPTEADVPSPEEAQASAAVAPALDPAALRERLASGDRSGAEEVLASIEAAGGADDPEVARIQGMALLAVGRVDEAAATWQRLLAADAADEGAWLGLAAAEARRSGPAAAVTVYRRASEALPGSVRVRVGLVGALRDADRLDEAERAAREALRISAADPDLYNNLGLVYLDLGRVDLARFIFEKALVTVEGGKQHPGIRCNLGRVHALRGDRAAARQAWREALELDPEHVPSMVFLAVDHLRNRAYDRALPLLQQADALQPDDPTILLDLAIALRGTGDLDGARATLERVLALHPDDADAALDLAILLADYVRDFDAAIAAYERYGTMPGADPELARQRIEEARKEADRIRRIEERRRRAEEERRRREEERRRLEELARQAEEQQQDPAPAEDAAPGEDAAAPGEDAAAPAEDVAPAGSEPDGGGDAPPQEEP